MNTGSTTEGQNTGGSSDGAPSSFPLTKVFNDFLDTVDRTYERPAETPPEAPAKPSLPYPWCRQPERCAGKGYCPRDPNCGD